MPSDLEVFQSAVQELALYQERVQACEASVRELRAEHSSQDGVVTVTCTGTGIVCDVRLSVDRLANLDELRLERSVIEARDRARRKALDAADQLRSDLEERETRSA